MTAHGPRDAMQDVTSRTGRPAWPLVLRAVREARGVTQDGWAAHLGVGRRTVQRWERGEVPPDAAAETAILAYCEERGLYRRHDEGPLAGVQLTPGWLSDLLSDARSGAHERRSPVAGASASLGRSPAHLPAPPSSFVGRDDEIEEVRRLLDGARLLTLTGFGGIGKTRLALEAASGLRAAYPDGTWLVELSGLADPALVPHAVAATLGIREERGRPVVVTLADTLAPGRSLLVLDNCEHLVAACATLADGLLRGCPELTIMATSRETLGTHGEVQYRVPPLSLPDEEPVAGGERLSGYDAIRLLVVRARAVRSSFALTDANAAAAVRLCRRLDGIPLAIELAAARLSVLSIEQLVDRLDDRFRLLAGGSRTAPTRQQTLRATIDWSHDLLDERERALLRRLSVFVGGWTLEAAEAVCAGGVVAPSETLDLLARLVEKSLVQVEQADGTVSYRLLETIHQYSDEKLAAAGETDAVRERHRDWYLGLAERAEPHLTGPMQVAWLAQLDSEHDNLRAALAGSNAAGDVEACARIAAATWRYWYARGLLHQGREWLAIALAGATPPVLRAKLLVGAGSIAWQQGDYARARTLHEQSLALARAAGDERASAAALNGIGLAALEQGDYARAAWRFEESAALYRRAGDTGGIATALANLGVATRQLGKHEPARRLYEESLALFREAGDRSGMAAALTSLGVMAQLERDGERAAACHEQSLALSRELGDPRGAAIALANLAVVASGLGDQARAEAAAREGLALRRDLGDKRGVADGVQLLGQLALAGGRPERATRLFGAAQALRAAVGSVPAPDESAAIDRAIAAARAALRRRAAPRGPVSMLKAAMRRLVREVPIVDVSRPHDWRRRHDKLDRAARMMEREERVRGPFSPRPQSLQQDLYHRRLMALGTPLHDLWRARTLSPIVSLHPRDAAFAAAWEAGMSMTLAQAVAEALGEDRPAAG